MTEVCWQVTSVLVEKQSIWELFVDSNGLELVMDFCRWPEWSATVFRVLEVMLLLQFQSEPIEPMDVGAPELQVDFFSTTSATYYATIRYQYNYFFIYADLCSLSMFDIDADRLIRNFTV